MTTRMQQRRGTAEQWDLIDPILASGEFGFETDTGKFKIGDGIQVWSLLKYFTDATVDSPSLDNYVPLNILAEPDGVATLDATGQVPANQLGNAPDPDLSAYATTSFVNNAIESVVGLAPEQLDTLAEIADAFGDNASFLTDVNASIATKQNKVTGVSDTEIGYLDGVTSGIQAQLSSKLESSDLSAYATTQYVDDEISAIPAPDYTGLATEDYVDTAISDIPLPDLTGYATESYVDTAVENIVGLAPEDLNTLAELADALGDNPAAITTLQSDVAALESDKADTNSPTFTGLTDFQGIVDFSDAVVVGIDALPDQTGNDGKYLTTDGNTASWQTVASPVPHPFVMMG